MNYPQYPLLPGSQSDTLHYLTFAAVFLQIEDILKEKITEFWKNVSSALVDYDYKGDSHISHKNLKKVIDNYVLPVADEHFERLVFFVVGYIADLT